MEGKLRLIALFAAVGFVGGCGATIVLWFFVGPENSYAVLGVREPSLLAYFPFVGAVLALLWSACFSVASFGAPQGAVVAFLAFLSFCALLGGFGPNGVWGFVGFAFFGFLLFGWLLVVLGALAGRHFRRRMAHGAL